MHEWGTLQILKLFFLYHGVSPTKVEMILTEYDHSKYMESLAHIVEIEETLEEIEWDE